MKKKRIGLLIWEILAVVTLFSQTAAALPTFQVYAPGAVAGDQPGDQDTWFINAPATITVVGAFDNTKEPPFEALTDVWLLFSVPEGQTGTISVTPDGLAASKVSAGTAIGSYATKVEIPAPTGGPTFNNHAPTGDLESDFYYFNIGDFDVADGHLGLWNYDANDGSTSYAPNAFGVELSYDIGFSEFERVHIDVYGFAVGERGTTAEEGRWKINPGSHDTTVVVPAPGAILLCGIGVGLVGWLRRRRTL